MEHALLSSGDHGESQTFKYERDTDLATWIRADGCSRWLRTARMSTPRRPRASLDICSEALSPSTRLTLSHTGWLVLAAQKVAPSVQKIEDAKRDKLIQADIEGQ